MPTKPLLDALSGSTALPQATPSVLLTTLVHLNLPTRGNPFVSGNGKLKNWIISIILILEQFLHSRGVSMGCDTIKIKPL
jgi:hypothetical protein